MKKSIAIDHGNRMIKTATQAFPSGYVESGHLPHLGGDVLTYEGKEYTLSDKRMAQKNDKTVDESFFILTLFALGKELVKEFEDEDASSEANEKISVELLVGLPPLHYKAMYKKFEKYFTNRAPLIEFEFNNQQLSVEITSAQVFPQAYAAALTAYDRFKGSQVVNVVDIGGHTVDCLQLVRMKPNMDVCTSLYMGVNTLFQRINEQVRATGAQNIHEGIIESILLEDWSTLGDYSKARIELVQSCASKFASDLLNEVAQTGLDLLEDKTVFVGGGSILIKDYLARAGKAVRAIFVDDLHANAKGYHVISKTQRANNG